MRIAIILVMTGSALCGSYASAAAQESERFDAISAMFDQGKSFAFKDNLGWYTGRCWRPYSDDAENGLLVMEQRRLDGPAFSAVPKFSIYQFPHKASNYFDVYPVPKQADPFERKPEVKLWPELIRAEFLNDWMDMGRLSAEGDKFQIAFGKLAPMALRRSSDDKYFVVKKGESLSCYFFKKVHRK